MFHKKNISYIIYYTNTIYNKEDILKKFFILTILCGMFFLSACTENISNVDIQKLNQKASQYMEAGEYDKAIENFAQALKITNTVGEIYFHLAQAYQAKKSYADAITNYQIAKELDNQFSAQAKKGIKFCRKAAKTKE